jgi:hypothetical protein
MRAARAAAQHAALSTVVDAITSQDARSYFRHCGYPAR